VYVDIGQNFEEYVYSIRTWIILCYLSASYLLCMQRTASIQLRGLEVLRIEMMVGPFLLIASNQDSIKIPGALLLPFKEVYKKLCIFRNK
jgi:hypothetical protein